MSNSRTHCPECGSAAVWRMLWVEADYFALHDPPYPLDVWQCNTCWAEWECPTE